MPPGLTIPLVLLLVLPTQPAAVRQDAKVVALDLDGDGDLDIVLAKGRHWPLVNRVLLNNGAGPFMGSDLAPEADRSYSTVLADLDGNGSLDLVVSNDRPDGKVVYFNNGAGRFRKGGSWGAPAWTTRNARLVVRLQ